MAVFFSVGCRRMRRIPCALFPNTWDGHGAFRTGTIPEPVLRDIMPGTADEQRAAMGAACVRAVAIDIPFIHIMQPSFTRNLPRAVQRFRRSVRLIAELEVGM